jgi:hypothetical protein
VLSCRCRQRAGIEQHGQIVGRLVGHASAGDVALVPDLVVNHRDFLDLVIQHDREILALVCARKLREVIAGCRGQEEVDLRLAGVGVLADAGAANIGAAHFGRALDLVVLNAAGLGNSRSGRHNHRVERHIAAQLLQRVLLAGVRTTQHRMNLQARRGLNDILHTTGIIDARQLDQDLVAAQVVLLNHRLAHAECIDAGADDLDRLLQRMRLQVGHRAGLHGQRPGIVRARSNVVLRAVLRVQDAANIVAAIRGSSADLNGVRTAEIRRNRANRDAVGLQILLDMRRVAVAGDAYRLIHHHLQDEMGAALEVETEVDSLQQRSFKRCAAESAGKADDAEDKDNDNGDDQNSFAGEILTHGTRMCWSSLGASLLGDILGGYRGDRAFDHFDLDVIRRNAKLDGVVLDGEDGPANAAAGRDLIPWLQVVEHLLPGLLLFLVGTNQQQIKDTDDQNKRKKLQHARRDRNGQKYC